MDFINVVKVIENILNLDHQKKMTELKTMGVNMVT
jgi:hypothetical protein